LITHNRRRPALIVAWITIPLLAGMWFYYLSTVTWLMEKVMNFGHFFFLGLGGAIIANATGAGGGIVFIPAFSSLGLSSSEALATSIMIQCFGMTAGSIAWWLNFKRRPAVLLRYSDFVAKVVLIAGLSSVAGVLCSQLGLHSLMTFSMVMVFSMLTTVFGLILVVSIYYSGQNTYPRTTMTGLDYLLVIIVSFVGGVITSVISIGAGEVLLILLFLRRYPMHVSIFIAVCVSAITVLGCAPYQVFVEQAVVWDIVAFAAPAAVVGGTIGCYLALLLGARRVKLFCAIWILATGLVM